jgi:MinD-like ATPase involved in chromosome partitioning or flagellar assembly
VSLLKNIPIFKNLTQNDFNLIDELIYEVEFKKGHVLFSQGDPSDSFFIIKSGAVRIIRHDGGKANELATLKSGEFFGEIGVIQNADRTTDVILAEDSTLLAIDKNEFQRFMAINPAISMKIMAVMAGRYRANTKGVEKKIDGETIAFFSATGGVGNSFVSANLAVALKEQTKKDVIVIDLDMMFGDQAGIFDIRSERSLADLHGESEIDLDMISDLIIKSSSGVDVLQSPPKAEESELIGPDLVKVVIELLETKYDYIVMDTANAVQDMAIMLIENVDRGFYVVTPEFLSVKNSHRWLKIVEMINISTNDIELILNKNYSKDPNLPREIEKQLKKTFFAELPFDSTKVRKSLDNAKPFLTLYPESPMTESIKAMAAKLAGEEVKKPGRKSLWNSLFG